MWYLRYSLSGSLVNSYFHPLDVAKMVVIW